MAFFLFADLENVISVGRRSDLRAGVAVAAVAFGLMAGAPQRAVAAEKEKASAPAETMMAQKAAVAEGETSASVADGSKLEGVIILSRHGVRSPLKPIAKMNEETSATWPTWDVEPGYLTTRGRRLVVGMGGYYRERFLEEGLLTGNDAEDAKHTYVHANVIQRTVQTACALAEGLHPETTTTVYRLEAGQQDALYYGSPIDDGMKMAAIYGRIGHDTEGLLRWIRPQMDMIEEAIGTRGLFGKSLSSLQLAASMADSFMLEYCEGLPMKDVAWGRADKAQLMEMYKVLATDFDIQLRTPYLAQRRMSNLVGHMAATLKQVTEGKRVDGAFGDGDDRVFIIVGHDTTVASVGGLLGLEWLLPDTGRNLCPPHGALVFELRRAAGEGEGDAGGKTGKKFVRVYYAAETLTQMHEDAKLSLKNPPAIAPIFVPGASTNTPHFDCPLEDFLKAVDGRIDKSLVVPVDDGKY